MQRLLACHLGLVALAILPSCSSKSSTSSDAGTGTQSMWIVPASLDQLTDVDVYDHPWPSDLRLDPDGSIHLVMYNPRQLILINDYIAAMKGVIKGFSPTAEAYLRFTGDIDPTTLPTDPVSATQATSSVQLVDVDPSSPEHGKRKLLESFWQQADGVYWLHDTLAVRPALGYPLRPKTHYALVVTNAVKALDGSTITPSADLAEVLGLAPLEARVQAAHDLYAPAVAELANLGISAASIVHLAAFTTNDPTADMFAIADDDRKNVAAPVVDASSWTATDQTSDYAVYEGTYPSPSYQQGTPPFSNQGGALNVDPSGKASVVTTFSQQFALVVPNATTCPMPATGYPIVLYAHGTGGNYRSVVDEGNSFGDLMAQHCLASMGINQPFCGNRPGAPPPTDPNLAGDEDLLFINLNNPVAARANSQQGAVDIVHQARLFTDTHVTVPATVSRTGKAIAFDGSKLLFIGHSQGGTNGPLFFAADDQALGGVLSGSGAMITIAMLEKTKPQPSVAQAVKTLLELNNPTDAAELNSFHPAAAMLQTIVDATDPINYARFIVQEPRSGFVPKSVFITEGVNPDGTGDSYAPPHGIELHAVALGVPRETPGVHTIAEAAWGGLGDVTIPAAGLQGNLAGGKATGVLGQFVPAPNDDGHFVAFDVPAAHAQVGAFCQSLAAGAPGTMPPLPQ
jgi:hypothetical protein